MIIQIFSKNKYLLDILNRNPNTDFGLYAKKMKNGVVVGNCVSSFQYDIVFQDKKYSYLPEESNQIDFQSYVSPLAVLHITNEFFTNLLKNKTEYWQQPIKWLNKTYQEVDNESCTIKVASFFIDSSWAKKEQFLLSKYFPQIEINHKIGANYELIITGKNVFEAINLLNLVSVLVHITNNYGIFTFIDDSFAEKYARVLTNIDNVPYFVFYLFIKKAIKSQRQFEIFKPVLEHYFAQQNMNVDFKFGYNHQERVNYITNRLNLENEIVDVGCGEYIYYRKLTKMGYQKPYFAIDEDLKFKEMANYMMGKLNTENLIYFQSLVAFKSVYNQQEISIILTEVIEHNSKEEAKNLIEQLLQFQFEQIFISTPNKDFNSHYFENPDEMRHHDHDFEMTSLEFKAFMGQFKTADNHLIFDQIGDSINQTCPTQICIISKTKKHD